MADKEFHPPSRTETLFDFLFQFTLWGIGMGVSYLASRFFEMEWHLAHYLIFAGVSLVVVASATNFYLKSRQILP